MKLTKTTQTMKEEPTIYSHSFYPRNGIRVTITGEGKDFIYIDTLMKSAQELLEALEMIKNFIGQYDYDHLNQTMFNEHEKLFEIATKAIKKATD